MRISPIVALLDAQTETIHFHYHYGEGENFDPMKLGEGLTSKIIQTGEPLLINKDVDERTQEIGATNVGRESLSYLGVPIKTGKGDHRRVERAKHNHGRRVQRMIPCAC